MKGRAVKEIAMATETDKFLENYKRLENVLQETGQGSVLDFENAHQTEVDADQTADKVKIARLMRNYITHHADGKTFLTVTPAMNRFLTRLADREEAEIQHVKDIMVRQKPLTPDMALKDAVSALSKSKSHWAAVVDKSGAKSYTKDYGLSTAALKSIGVETHKDKLKPGDIIVRCNVGKDGYLGNAVMYLGSTEYGNFTIIECNSDKKSDGVVIRGYESFNAFRSRRSRNYKYLRDPFTVKALFQQEAS